MGAKEQQRDDLHRKLCEAAARGDFGDCQYLLDELNEIAMTRSNEGAVTTEQEQPSATQSPMYGHWCGVIGSRGQMWFCCSLSHVNLNSERDDAVCKHGCGWLRPVRENNDTLLERVLNASKRVADAHGQCLAASVSGPDSKEWTTADLKRREACAELYRAVTAARNNEAL